MFKVLFIFFIIIPIVEIMVLMNVGSMLGVAPTIALVILTAWAGAAMVRQQGLATFQSVQGKLNQGEIPSDEIIAALLLLVAGVLLLTPGFITDGFGLLLLWPVSRKVIVAALKKHFVVAQSAKGNVFEGQFTQQGFKQPFEQPFEPNRERNLRDNIENSSGEQKSPLDGEFERKD